MKKQENDTKKTKVKIYYLSQQDRVPFYVGKTKNLLSERVYSHKIKFGFDILIEELDIVENEEWEFWEKHYISLFKSWGFELVNQNEGGGGLKFHSNKTKEKISYLWNSKTEEEKININKKRGLGNINKKKPGSGYRNQSKEDIQKLIQRSPFIKSNWGERKMKSVIMLDKITGEILKEFKSVTEAALYINVSQPSLSEALIGKSKTSGGFKWKYKILPE